ncbi:MAG: alanine racemase [bacterium]|nr:alanine racemase [bacterium]
MAGARPTRAAIDLEALAGNFAEARRLAAGRSVLAVVKADGYGHGAVPVARSLARSGCSELAVATVAEGAELRVAGIALPILVLGGIHHAAEAAEAVALRLVPAVHHAGQISWLSEAARSQGRTLSLQVEVDTGMARMGVPLSEAAAVLEQVESSDLLVLDGVFTHLACADESDLEPSVVQLRRFGTLLAEARKLGIAPRRVHVANSAGLLATADLASASPPEVNAVRPGLMLYGVPPAAHLRERATLAPVMSLQSEIVAVRRVAAGESVGYGAAWRATQPTRIATVPLGYADGIPWGLGGRGIALVAGCRVPFAGRVSMDLVTLDLGPVAAQIGDPVVLFGREPGEAGATLPVEEVAQMAETIPYELLVRVGSRVPRVEG